MNLKQQAASMALEYVRNGMYLGLGTGSTTAYFIDLLGAQLQGGTLKDIIAVATSEATATRARQLGIPLTTLAQITKLRSSKPLLDLAVDGADEVDLQLDMIKGLGRALLREKIIETHARNFVVIVDEAKRVSRLGSKCPLPVEILPFEADAHINWLNTLDCRAEMWLEEGGSPVVTDNGNYLALCYFESGIADPYGLARVLADRPGIIEHGLFLEMASQVIVAGSAGIQILSRETTARPGGV